MSTYRFQDVRIEHDSLSRPPTAHVHYLSRFRAPALLLSHSLSLTHDNRLQLYKTTPQCHLHGHACSSVPPSSSAQPLRSSHTRMAKRSTRKRTSRGRSRYIFTTRRFAPPTAGRATASLCGEAPRGAARGAEEGAAAACGDAFCVVLVVAAFAAFAAASTLALSTAATWSGMSTRTTFFVGDERIRRVDGRRCGHAPGRDGSGGRLGSSASSSTATIRGDSSGLAAAAAGVAHFSSSSSSSSLSSRHEDRRAAIASVSPATREAREPPLSPPPLDGLPLCSSGCDASREMPTFRKFSNDEERISARSIGDGVSPREAPPDDGVPTRPPLIAGGDGVNRLFVPSPPLLSLEGSVSSSSSSSEILEMRVLTPLRTVSRIQRPWLLQRCGCAVARSIVGVSSDAPWSWSERDA